MTSIAFAKCPQQSGWVWEILRLGYILQRILSLCHPHFFFSGTFHLHHSHLFLPPWCNGTFFQYFGDHNIRTNHLEVRDLKVKCLDLSANVTATLYVPCMKGTCLHIILLIQQDLLCLLHLLPLCCLVIPVNLMGHVVPQELRQRVKDLALEVDWRTEEQRPERFQDQVVED